MNLIAVFGTVLGLMVILFGQLLEGGSLGQIIQPTALFIVFGGTLAATLLAYPLQEVAQAFRMISSIYASASSDVRPVIEEIVRVATIVRKEGVLALESQQGALTHPVLKKSIKYVIDGANPAAVREIIDAEIRISMDGEENSARVFESAARFASWVGWIGAGVCLVAPAKAVDGIPSAGVAVIYGLALGNLLLLPWCIRLRRMAALRAVEQEVVKQGVIGVLEGLSPNFLEEKLEVFIASRHKNK